MSDVIPILLLLKFLFYRNMLSLFQSIPRSFKAMIENKIKGHVYRVGLSHRQWESLFMGELRRELAIFYILGLGDGSKTV